MGTSSVICSANATFPKWKGFHSPPAFSASFPNFSVYRCANALEISVDIQIAEAQHRQVKTGMVLVPLRITLLLLWLVVL